MGAAISLYFFLFKKKSIEMEQVIEDEEAERNEEAEEEAKEEALTLRRGE